jgi:hypothetical protein
MENEAESDVIRSMFSANNSSVLYLAIKCMGIKVVFFQ